MTYTDDTNSNAASAASAADVAIVFGSVDSSEGADRGSLSLPPAFDALVSAVAAANHNTIVVLNVPGAVLMPWLDQVAGVLVAWYPGQENGKTITPILFGDENPSGKLPVTFPKSAGSKSSKASPVSDRQPPHLNTTLGRATLPGRATRAKCWFT